MDFQRGALISVLMITSGLAAAWAAPATGPAAAGTLAIAAPLRALSEFDAIVDRKTRSVALFIEAGRVIQSPRCMNCHPATRTPTQGDDLHAHVPFMQAGTAGQGPAGLGCRACHQADNVRTSSASIETIPGHPHWALAPATMAWQGKSLGAICTQIKDPAHNGGRSLANLHDHMATDTLVGWAWRPGLGRAPAPGTQADFGRLIEAWIATGAACPSP
jgi:hypothetical protein